MKDPVIFGVILGAIIGTGVGLHFAMAAHQVRLACILEQPECAP